MSRVEGCLFCAIVAGDIPATVVRESERTLAFRDINPAAPTHVLVITKDHHENVGALVDPESAADVLALARRSALAEGLEPGYRVVFNNGAAAQQTVFHAHAHVLGGRPLSWPPG